MGKASIITSDQFNDFDRLSEVKKKEALRWAAIIREFEVYAKKCGRKKRHKSMKDFCLKYRIEHPEEKHFKWRTLHENIRDFRIKGIVGLVNKSGRGKKPAEWPKEAKAYLWQLYNNINAPAASWCIKETALKAKEMGWELPSKSTMQRFVSQIPQETKDYYRKGKKFWRQHYVPSVLRDYKSMVPGELYVSDHQQINVAVKHPSGKVIFPWFTGWMDMRTRKILSWHLDVVPSGDTINISLNRALEKYSVPEHAIIDNGPDYSSIQFTGGQTKRFRFKVNEAEVTGKYRLLGIEPHFCIPANPKSKSIERWFWTQELNFQKAFSTYRGNHVLNRPEGVDGRIKNEKHVIKWDDFLNFLEDYIACYNEQHSHRGHGMEGRTPNDVWNEYFSTHAVRRASLSSLRLLMMKPSKLVKVGRFGIAAFNNHYRSDSIMDHQGELINYRYDPKDLSLLHVYAANGAFIGVVEKIHRTAWNDENAFKVIKKFEKKRRKALKDELEANKGKAEVEFGYRPRGVSEERPERPSNVTRILRTPFDGVQKQIDDEVKRAVAVADDQDGAAGQYRNLFSIENHRRSEVEATPRRSPIRLTINDPHPDEDY